MPTIRQALQSALDESGGAIPFDTFMGLALHHPEDGYYTRNIRAIGNRGDFTTVPEHTPVLGEAIGRWLQAEAERRRWTRFNVIECGPGSGALAAAVMRSFGWFGKRKVSLHLVETSQPLRQEQVQRVRAAWHASIGEALAACDGRALICHNEFLDAFPCRVFRRRADDWEELFLRVEDGRLTGFFAPPIRPLPDSHSLRGTCADGQCVEVFESVSRWMSSMAGSWSAGAMLAIDYGGTTDEIYRRRPAGTLRAYRGQQRLTGSEVWETPGRQDITADVNFDDLAAWGRRLGWAAGGLEPLENLAPGAPGDGAFKCLAFAADLLSTPDQIAPA